MDARVSLGLVPVIGYARDSPNGIIGDFAIGVIDINRDHRTLNSTGSQ